MCLELGDGDWARPASSPPRFLLQPVLRCCSLGTAWLVTPSTQQKVALARPLTRPPPPSCFPRTPVTTRHIVLVSCSQVSCLVASLRGKASTWLVFLCLQLVPSGERPQVRLRWSWGAFDALHFPLRRPSFLSPRGAHGRGEIRSVSPRSQGPFTLPSAGPPPGCQSSLGPAGTVSPTWTRPPRSPAPRCPSHPAPRPHARSPRQVQMRNNSTPAAAPRELESGPPPPVQGIPVEKDLGQQPGACVAAPTCFLCCRAGLRGSFVWGVGGRGVLTGPGVESWLGQGCPLELSFPGGRVSGEFVNLSAFREDRRLARGETTVQGGVQVPSWTKKGVSGETGEIRVKPGV